MTRKTTKKAAKASKPAIDIDVEYVAKIARPIIEKDRCLRPSQIGHILRAAYPSARWSASELRKVIDSTFEVVIDLP